MMRSSVNIGHAVAVAPAGDCSRSPMREAGAVTPRQMKLQHNAS